MTDKTEVEKIRNALDRIATALEEQNVERRRAAMKTEPEKAEQFYGRPEEPSHGEGRPKQSARS